MDIKICRPWCTTRGGAERVVIEIAKRLSKKHDVEFIVNYYEPNSTFKEFGEFGMNVAKPLLPYNWKLSRALGSALYFYNKRIECDAIIADISPAHWLANRNDNVVYYCHSPLRDAYDLYEEHVLERAFYRRPFYRFSAGVYRYVDARIVPKIRKICTNSAVSQERIKRYYKRKSQIIHPGVNPKEFRCEEYQPYFLWVGRFMTHKRPWLAVDAMGELSKEHPGFFLRMVGGEAEGGAMKPGRNVEIMHRASYEELKGLYANCLAFVYTSRDEEWSITCLEAMASGKPVIAVDEGCAKELVKDKVNGLLCKPNYKSISDAMKWFISHPEEARRMGRNARKTVESDYTWEKFGNEFERMLNSFLKESENGV